MSIGSHRSSIYNICRIVRRNRPPQFSTNMLPSMDNEKWGFESEPRYPNFSGIGDNLSPAFHYLVSCTTSPHLPSFNLHQTCLPLYHEPRSAYYPSQQLTSPHNALLKSDGIFPPLLPLGARSEMPTSSPPPGHPRAKYLTTSPHPHLFTNARKPVQRILHPSPRSPTWRDRHRLRSEEIWRSRI